MECGENLLVQLVIPRTEHVGHVRGDFLNFVHELIAHGTLNRFFSFFVFSSLRRRLTSSVSMSKENCLLPMDEAKGKERIYCRQNHQREERRRNNSTELRVANVRYSGRWSHPDLRRRRTIFDPLPESSETSSENSNPRNCRRDKLKRNSSDGDGEEKRNRRSL